MFTAWLLDQRDRLDSVGLLANAAYEDHNSGCANMYPDPVSWKHHFEEKHRKQLPRLMEGLGDAYVEYCMQFDKKDDLY
jgi:hypothetical protein